MPKNQASIDILVRSRIAAEHIIDPSLLVLPEGTSTADLIIVDQIVGRERLGTGVGATAGTKKGKYQNEQCAVELSTHLAVCKLKLRCLKQSLLVSERGHEFLKSEGSFFIEK